MPTAPKLVAGVCLMVVAWLVSEAIRPLWPEGTNFGNFNYWNMLIGLLCGWMILGARAGRGVAAGISNGTTSVVMMALVGLFAYATEEMVDRSFRRFYDSPFEAIGSIFELALDYGGKIADGEVFITLLIGGILAGILTETASRRWS